MEFSFDRNTVARNRPSSAGASSSTEQPQTFKPDDGIDTSTIANERLRKAIERNRARQAERMKQRPGQEAAASVEPQPIARETKVESNNAQEGQEQASLFDQPQAARPRAQERLHASATTAGTAAIVTRKSPARADEADFTPVKRAPRKVASHLSYTTSSSRKKAKALDPKWQLYLVRGSWIFCAILVFRLIFASGGVSDFYNQKVLYQDRLKELSRIKKENMQMVREIERMQTDFSYQKKLVRDNLGFIASDEFLVLFPKEKSVQ